MECLLRTIERIKPAQHADLGDAPSEKRMIEILVLLAILGVAFFIYSSAQKPAAEGSSKPAGKDQKKKIPKEPARKPTSLKPVSGENEDWELVCS